MVCGRRLRSTKAAAGWFQMISFPSCSAARMLAVSFQQREPIMTPSFTLSTFFSLRKLTRYKSLFLSRTANLRWMDGPHWSMPTSVTSSL
uniref:Putative secreted protein n=1 Tax=Ixodes ricinus TaxID=34613 RepID=A0A6B0UBX4_IXORI